MSWRCDELTTRSIGSVFPSSLTKSALPPVLGALGPLPLIGHRVVIPYQSARPLGEQPPAECVARAAACLPFEPRWYQLLAQDPMSRVACETRCTTDLVVLAGEITTKAQIDYAAVARKVIRDIGYTSDDIGFNADTCRIFLALHSQSGDIAQGVDRDGAGDQGLMFGYACDQTEELMPVPIAYAHRLINRLAEVRLKGGIKWLRPDSKSQVTVEYDGSKTVRVDAIVI